MKIKAGHEAQAARDFSIAYQVAHGRLGWGGSAKMMVSLGLDSMFRVSGKKRIRNKKMKKLLQRAFWQSLMEHVEE